METEIPPSIGGLYSASLPKHQYMHAHSVVGTGLPGGSDSKEPACDAGDLRMMQVQSLGQKDPLEEKMAAHSSVLAWEIPWTEESGGLQSMVSQRVRHD